MFVQTVEFKREQSSEWERGFYIGRSDNDGKDKSIYLDNNYQPLPRDEKGCQIWNFRHDFNRDIILDIKIQDEQE